MNDWLSIRTGVKQREMLSQLPFIIFIDRWMKKVKIGEELKIVLENDIAIVDF